MKITEVSHLHLFKNSRYVQRPQEYNPELYQRSGYNCSFEIRPHGSPILTGLCIFIWILKRLIF